MIKAMTNIATAAIGILSISLGCSQPDSAVSSTPGSAFRPEGQERGGGDIAAIRLAVLNPEIEKLSLKVAKAFEGSAPANIRDMTIRFLQLADQMPEGKSRKIILDLISKGAIKDLQERVQFSIQAECIDTFDKSKRSATAVMNPKSDRQFVVCIDPVKIATDRGPQIPDSELIGLAVHEISHFYGYRDQDHSLAADVTRFVFKATQQIDGESHFHLVPLEVSESLEVNPFGWPSAKEARRICYDSNIPKYRKIVKYLGNVLHSDVWVYLNKEKNESMPCFQEPIRVLVSSTKGELVTLELEVLESERVESIYLQDDLHKMMTEGPTKYSGSEEYKVLLKKSEAKGVSLEHFVRNASTVKAVAKIAIDSTRNIGVTRTYWESHSGELEGAAYFESLSNAGELGFQIHSPKTLLRLGKGICGISNEVSLDEALARGVQATQIIEAYYKRGVGEIPTCLK